MCHPQTTPPSLPDCCQSADSYPDRLARSSVARCQTLGAVADAHQSSNNENLPQTVLLLINVRVRRRACGLTLSDAPYLPRLLQLSRPPLLQDGLHGTDEFCSDILQNNQGRHSVTCLCRCNCGCVQRKQVCFQLLRFLETVISPKNKINIFLFFSSVFTGASRLEMPTNRPPGGTIVNERTAAGVET